MKLPVEVVFLFCNYLLLYFVVVIIVKSRKKVMNIERFFSNNFSGFLLFLGCAYPTYHTLNPGRVFFIIQLIWFTGLIILYMNFFYWDVHR